MQNAATSNGNFLRRASICTKRLKAAISQHLNKHTVLCHYFQLCFPVHIKWDHIFGSILLSLKD